MLTYDYETRCGADINLGPHVYTNAPDFQVLCVTYKEDNGQTKLRSPVFPHLGDMGDFFDAMDRHTDHLCHNAPFEWAVNKALGHEVDFERMTLDTAARARANFMPAGLDILCKIYGLQNVKMKIGSTLIKRLCAPGKNGYYPLCSAEEFDCAFEAIEQMDGFPNNIAMDAGKRFLRNKHPDVFGSLDKADKAFTWAAFFKYAMIDVDATYELHGHLPLLHETEVPVYVLDHKINVTGAPVDTDLCKAGLSVWDKHLDRLNDHMDDLIGCNATQIGLIKDWVEGRGISLPIKTDKEGKKSRCLDKTVIRDLLRDYSDDDTLCDVLRTRKAAGSVTKSKFKAGLERADEWDGRCRNMYLYMGASATGRWSSKGLQTHNLSQMNVEDDDEIDHLLKLTFDRDEAAIHDEWGVVPGLKNHARLMFHEPGKYIGTCDFSGIENKGTAWVSNDWDLMEKQKDKGYDPYCDFASVIFGKPINKKDHPYERQIGKIAVLSLGYQAGWSSYRKTCYDWAELWLDAPMCKDVVDKFRKRFVPKLAQAWYSVEDLFRKAFRTHRETFWEIEAAGVAISFKREGDDVVVRLPSGRPIRYNGVHFGPSRFGGGKTEIRFYRPWFFCQKKLRPVAWARTNTYGGSILQSCVQGFCRDLLAGGMLAVDEAGYEIIMHTHDECSVLLDQPDEFDEFQSVFLSGARSLPWAKGIVINGDGGVGRSGRYCK